ncbi:MAG: hypothetical protein M0R80_09050 [Proteobacteria bacterium]|jgi:hypothetical protein|nr:hypothetical protein [Pseudomonadota bacterium]
MTRAAAIAATLLLAGCGKTGLIFGETAGSDADADSDADTDVDGDTDTGIPATVWVRSAGGPGEDRASHVATAADGTSIAVGSFEQTAVFGEGEPGEIALAAAGGKDVFVAAYGPDGALLWAERAGSAGIDTVLGADAFADGTSIVTGQVEGDAVFGEGEANETTLPWGDEEYAFFAAWYAADGGLIEVVSEAGGAGAAGYAAAALEDGSAIVVGIFVGSILLGEGEPGEVELTATPGCQQGFFARYDPSRSLVFARATDGDGNLFPYDVVAYPDGSFAMAGAFSGTLVLGSGEPNEATLYQSNIGLVVARFDPDGALAWAVTANGLPQGDGGRARAIGEFGDGGVTVAGDYSWAVTFGQGEPNQTTLTGYLGGMFTAAYEPDGSLAWAVKAGKGSGHALASMEGAAGPIYAAGQFGWSDGTITFGAETSGECVLATAGGFDVALARYDAEGAVIWTRAMGGIGTERPSALAALTDDSPVLVGSFEDAAAFDLGQPADDTVVSAGDRDMFIARLAP